MLVADTSVWVDFFNGRMTDEVVYLHIAVAQDLAAVSDLILYEVLQGFKTESGFREARDLLLSLPFVPMGGRRLTVQAATNFRYLRARGITIRASIDTLIATAVIEGNHQLLHSDRDFDHFEQHLGLRVLHPQPQDVDQGDTQ